MKTKKEKIKQQMGHNDAQKTEMRNDIKRAPPPDSPGLALTPPIVFIYSQHRGTRTPLPPSPSSVRG